MTDTFSAAYAIILVCFSAKGDDESSMSPGFCTVSVSVCLFSSIPIEARHKKTAKNTNISEEYKSAGVVRRR